MRIHFTRQKQLWMILFTIITPFLFISSRSSSNKTEDNPATIDLQKLIQNTQVVPLSRFVTSLEYIPLEYKQECPTSGPRVFVTNDFIFMRSGDGTLLLFDRKTGKFIRPIGKRGRGPEEYLRLLDCFYNPYDQKIYANAVNSVNTYNLKGEFIESFAKLKVKEPTIKDGYINASIEAFLPGDKYICYISNFNGAINKRIAIMTKNNELKSFPHFEKWSDPKNQYVPISQSPRFFSFGENVSFKEFSNDTIFYVTMEKLIPRLVLFSGELKHPYILTSKEAVDQFTKPKDYLYTLNIFENAKYLFFDLISKNKPIENKPTAFKLIRNLCIYDKENRSTVACKADEEDNSRLIDDINNFMPILPYLITENNEMVAILEAAEIVKWKAQNPNIAAKLITKLPWLDKIDELDNPVIVFGKCKN